MSETALPNRAKKGVGLSGIVAGNTALCTVGRSGNDLHYRGYDILDVADVCEFEEIAYLIVHGELPTKASARQASTSPIWRMANSTSLLNPWKVWRWARSSWAAT